MSSQESTKGSNYKVRVTIRLPGVLLILFGVFNQLANFFVWSLYRPSYK
ncbi:hypothetical protein A2U01_0027737, partial [Trifolium medium]|nr:hypothetical protein [Trifolium medium]